MQMTSSVCLCMPRSEVESTWVWGWTLMGMKVIAKTQNLKLKTQNTGHSLISQL